MDELKNASSRFASLLKIETEKRKKPNDALLLLKDHEEAIREARSFRISHARIAGLLVESGVNASVDTVRAFCQETLKETPLPRKKRRRKKVTKTGEINQSTAVATKTVPKPAAIQNTVRSTAPKHTPIKTGKAGFRVGRDEDL